MHYWGGRPNAPLAVPPDAVAEKDAFGSTAYLGRRAAKPPMAAEAEVVCGHLCRHFGVKAPRYEYHQSILGDTGNGKLFQAYGWSSGTGVCHISIESDDPSRTVIHETVHHVQHQKRGARAMVEGPPEKIASALLKKRCEKKAPLTEGEVAGVLRDFSL